MAGTINVDKLKNDAFNAIDSLFTDDNAVAESPSAGADEWQDAFTQLEKYILALDWEYTEKDIQQLLSLVQELSSSTEDKHTTTLLKILKNILTYLSRAKSKAHPESLGVAAEVVDGLKKVYSEENREEASKEVNRVYLRFKELKGKISTYNKKLQQEEGPQTRGQAQKGQTQVSADGSETEAEDLQPAEKNQENASPAFSAPSGKRGGSAEEIKFLNKKIEHLEKRQKELEELVRKMFADAGDSAASGYSPGTEAQGSTKKNEVQPVFDFSAADIDLSGEKENREEAPGDILSQPGEGGESPQDREEVAYVQVFSLDADIVALPSEYINNTYKLSGKNKKNISSGITSLPLRELSSLSQKLSRNMRGSLRGTTESALKNVTAEVVHIGGTALKKPGQVILADCGDRYLLMPVTKPHSGRLSLVTEMRREENKLSEYTVQIESLGSVPVYIPC